MVEEENKKKIEDLQKELLEDKVQLKGIDADEKQIYEEKRIERMEQIKKVKELYDNAKTMMDELLAGDFQLHGIDPKEKVENDKAKQARMEKFNKLKETVDQTSRLLEEIQQAPTLKKVNDNEFEVYNKNRYHP